MPSARTLLLLTCMYALVLSTKLTNGESEEPGQMGNGGGEDEESKIVVPPENRRKLGIIFDRADIDSDGFLIIEELEAWIRDRRQKRMHEDTEAEFKNHDSNLDGNVQWREYHDLFYGWNSGNSNSIQQLERDRARWKAADLNRDGVCSLEEYKAFLYPEEFDRMRDAILKERFDEMDSDKDGFLDPKEYIAGVLLDQLYRPKVDGEREPFWVEDERRAFHEVRDGNEDGKLDLEEVGQWIMPRGYNHAQVEAISLVQSSDENKDGKLTKDEMLNHYNVFLSSQVTLFGQLFAKHDEF